MIDQTRALKRCSKCKIEKPLLDAFYNSNHTKDGKQSWCKECSSKGKENTSKDASVVREYKRQYYQQNKEKIAAQQQAYYQQHKQELIERNRAYYAAHREEICQKAKDKRALAKGDVPLRSKAGK